MPRKYPAHSQSVTQEMEASIQEFELEVGGLIDFAEFMDEHGDRHMQAVAGAARSVFRRLHDFGARFEKIAKRVNTPPD